MATDQQQLQTLAKAARQNKRDTMTALVGAIVTLLAVALPEMPAEAIAPLNVILTIMVLRGHPST